MSLPTRDLSGAGSGKDAEGTPVHEFGPFGLDPRERLLTRDGQPVALTPKAFDLLVYLVERPGRLVEKQALMAALWPDAVVEEANLAYTVSALRKALGDGHDGEQIIQTVPTRGYRFVAPVRVVFPQPSSTSVGARLGAASSSRSYSRSESWRAALRCGSGCGRTRPFARSCAWSYPPPMSGHRRSRGVSGWPAHRLFGTETAGNNSTCAPSTAWPQFRSRAPPAGAIRSSRPTAARSPS
jgi:DNA-binding winged helix-turn-helix (wHTH) protein